MFPEDKIQAGVGWVLDTIDRNRSATALARSSHLRVHQIGFWKQPDWCRYHADTFLRTKKSWYAWYVRGFMRLFIRA